MRIRKYLFFILIILLPVSPFFLKDYIRFKKRIDNIDDYRKVIVKIDSFKEKVTPGTTYSNSQEVFYKYDGMISKVIIGEDTNNEYYKNFINSDKDFMYIWHNSKADDLYTVKDSTPLNLKHQKHMMYRSLGLFLTLLLLLLWFVFGVLLERIKNMNKN